MAWIFRYPGKEQECGRLLTGERLQGVCVSLLGGSMDAFDME